MAKVEWHDQYRPVMNQPAPTKQPHSEIVWPKAVEDFQDAFNGQVATGRKTYGTDLMTFNGRDAGADCMAELADATNYLTQLRIECAWLQARVRQLEDQLATAMEAANG